MAHSYVIFGASGDLTSRKLVPALFHLFRKGRLPPDTRIIGFSRSPFSHDEWRKKLGESTGEFTGDFDQAAWDRFAQSIYYHAGDIGDAASFAALGKLLAEIEQGVECTRVYYLATSPTFYEQALQQLGAAGLADEAQGGRRVVIEKPFGHDLASARRLNEIVHSVFAEQQVYRIDHYLGKETVQNILVLRFANTIFEPLWNRNYIDHVQITAAEEVLVGSRGSYYDKAGVLRDMFQNHLLQLLTVTAMEGATRFEADAIRNEKVKVLDAIRRYEPADVARQTVRGQYTNYRREPGVSQDSNTATFAAVRFYVDNWRWQGVPFYLRSGKGMSCRTTQLLIQFRAIPHLMFPNSSKRIEANRLLIQVQPAEGIQVHFQTKVPDAGMRMRLAELDFRFDRRSEPALPEAYERLLLDTMSGDASLFARSDEVELAWKLVDPIQKTWDELREPNLWNYEPGGWGPEESCEWIQQDGREWFDVCPVLG